MAGVNAIRKNPLGLVKSYRDVHDEEIRVCIYGRVSTLHEEQQEAFGRQMEWYEQILLHHPNWRVVAIYDDKSSGTRVIGRNGFVTMIDNAKEHKFDLILTREVGRFARNTIHSLEYTRMLKQYGVEVYFVNDNIWSMDTDGELRLTIFSALAQDESRKIAERVRAGQQISQKNGTLYGNGNILGYDLLRGNKPIDNTYIINEEQAATVRRIYELYLSGEGTKAIASVLIAEKRKDATGRIQWDSTKISRILRNKTYCGYKSYNKSHTVDFLSHTRVNNTNRSTYKYIKGDFEPIVSEEDWEKVQEIIATRKTEINGKMQCINTSKDKWCKKLICECGKTFKKYRWRTNQNGEHMYGFKCRNQIENKSREYRESHGMDGSGYCNVPCICEWKMDYMFLCIFRDIFNEPEYTMNNLYQRIADNYEYNPGQTYEQELANCKAQQELLDNRKNALLINWLDKKVDDASYQKMQSDFENKLTVLEEKIAELEAEKAKKEAEKNDLNVRRARLEKIHEVLNSYIDFSECTNEKVVNRFVDRVVPCENHVYKWYINLTGGRRSNSNNFNTDDYELYDYYTLGFKGAQRYRRERKSYLRKNQWNDIKIEIYIKV